MDDALARLLSLHEEARSPNNCVASLFEQGDQGAPRVESAPEWLEPPLYVFSAGADADLLLGRSLKVAQRSPGVALEILTYSKDAVSRTCRTERTWLTRSSAVTWALCFPKHS